MFLQKISQNIDILGGIHGNVFPRQPAIMGNKARLRKKSCSFSATTLNFCSNARDGHVSAHLKFQVNILNSLEVMTLLRSIYLASKRNSFKTASEPNSTAD